MLPPEIEIGEIQEKIERAIRYCPRAKILPAENKGCAPLFDLSFQTTSFNSQLPPSNPTAHKDHAYRCYLPVLTGFGTTLLRRT